MTAAPTYDCAAGYFCITASTSTQPERVPGDNAADDYQCDPFMYDNSNTGTLASLLMLSGVSCNQGICPKGYYCEEGTGWPTVCPAGKYNLNTREVSLEGCIDCIEGYHCPDKVTKTMCLAGTICP
jgi:hypothetical protein